MSGLLSEPWHATYLLGLAVSGKKKLLALDPVVAKLFDALRLDTDHHALQHLPLHAPQNPVVVLGGEVGPEFGLLRRHRPREERGHLEDVFLHRAGADEPVDGEGGCAGVREHVELPIGGMLV